MVADAGHDVAEVVDVLVGEGVEQEGAGEPDVAGQDAVDLADAALPSAGLTAWQALVEHAGLRAGQSVLVNGAGGAVGGYAVQLAARTGTAVTATASPRSVERVRSHGAQAITDYTRTPVTGTGERFDVVLNLVTTSAADTEALAGLVADGGVFVSTTTPGRDDAARDVRAVRMFARSDAAQLAELVDRVDAGALAIDVAARRPLADLATVHDEAVTGRLPGKTVLIP
ncbi:zinc-binding dehydrogenase [Nonomuraea sp. MG754425]|uniref:zinc-binding dehydrogenase n=1 Tax=Nonomuraea sp. MG754425 TaxID=2570319 RepID=UPI001F2E598A|nr:zinc-binding dehydrogenase [Nonomuraea sp. MG754425]